MATKLDQTIAKVAIAYGRHGRAALVKTASVETKSISAKDLAKLPDRDYGKLSAKLAGAPDLHDPWHHLFFEAIVELLLQRKSEGLPGLLILWELDTFSYPEYVLPALFRLAAEGVDQELIMERVRERLKTLHYITTRSGVREVISWSSEYPKIRVLLELMSIIVLPYSDGDTIGTYIHRFTEIEPA